jgi:hypothetical protein
VIGEEERESKFLKKILLFQCDLTVCESELESFRESVLDAVVSLCRNKRKRKSMVPVKRVEKVFELGFRRKD